MTITDNVTMLNASGGSHVYLVRGEENYLIDTGLPGFSDAILKEIASLKVPEHGLRAILLTHHDIDHIGNAARLQRATGAQIFASALDAPYITGAKKRPGFKQLLGTLTHTPAPEVSGTFDEKGVVGPFTALPAPGHTPGHTIFTYGRVVFTGDLFKTSGGRLRPMPGYMNGDTEQAKKSIGILKTLAFDWLCPGHGEPVQNGPAVKEFLAGF